MLLIDTFSLVYRAHHVCPRRTSASGKPIAALLGFLGQIATLIRQEQPTGVAFALESRTRGFRKVLNPLYKAQRGGTPEALKAQLPRLDELLAKLGAPALRADGFEADDILATLARDLREHRQPGLVVSGDRDLLVLAHGSIDVLFVGRYHADRVRYDTAAVEQRFGVPAERLGAVAALVGDRADNMPGVPRLGPRVAARLIRQWGDIDTLLSQLRAVQPPGVRRLLESYTDRIERNAEVLTLRDDVQITTTPRFVAVDTERIEAACAALEQD